MIKSTIDYVLLFVQNPIKSAQFYSNLFNIKPVEKSPTFALFVMANGVKLGLWSDKTAEPKVTAQPGSSEICIQTDEVDNIYASWGKLGVTMAQKPTDMDFDRTFVALDPDGHRIRVFKRTNED